MCGFSWQCIVVDAEMITLVEYSMVLGVGVVGVVNFLQSCFS